MADMSKWDADAPGDSAAWWISRKTHVPQKAATQFGSFIAALKEYHGNFSEDNLNALRWAIDDLVMALNLRSKSETRKLAIKALMPKLRSRDDVNAVPEKSNLEMALIYLKGQLGEETQSKGAKEWGARYVDSF